MDEDKKLSRYRMKRKTSAKSGADTAAPARHGGANATADRAVEMLLCFTASKPIWTLAELAEQLGMPRSTAYRYANSLRSSGLLLEDGGRLGIGPRVVDLARIAHTKSVVAQVAARHLRALHAAFGETVSLHERKRHEIVTLDVIECGHPLRMLFAEQNDMLPWPATANGKLLLAYAEPAECKVLLRTMSPVRYTNRTISSRPALQAELAQIRRKGYAVSDEERYEGLRGISAPVFGPNGEALAVSLGAPTFRMGDAHLRKVAKAILQTAKAITRDLRR